MIINDRADIARLVDATGVHLGTGDLPAAAARAILGPTKVIGLSTHNPDQLAAVLAVEEPGLRVWAVDPGDMATDLYASAVPDDGDPRPAPGSVVPGFLRLLDERPASGRYSAPALLEGAR